MSLVRLLTAGKSLVGLKDGEIQYRMGDPRSMPKFGTGENPFKGKGRSASSQPEVGQSGAAGINGPNRANTGLVVEAAGSSHSVTADEQRPSIEGACEPRCISEVCGLDNSGSLRNISDTPRLTDPPKPLSEPLSKTLSSAAQAEADAPALTVPSSPVRRKSLLAAVKSLFRVPLSASRKPGPTRTIYPPLQGELGLDNVKVLRNDLSDTDLEIVTKAPPKQAAPPKAESVVPNETAWDRVANLFGAEK
jgi:hypothetical protein